MCHLRNLAIFDRMDRNQGGVSPTAAHGPAHA